MIRVSTQVAKQRTVVTIEGLMIESDLKEVRRIRRTLGGDVSLKLRGLDVLAECGIRELRAWLDEGARLENANLFLRMKLEIGLNAPSGG